MKATSYAIFLILTLGVFTATNSFAEQAVEQELPLYSKIYDDKRDPFKDAVAAITLAKQTNRHVLIEIGGNWCVWCKKMDKFLDENPSVKADLHRNFVILKINVSDSNENEAFMKGLPPVLGYPHMFVSNASGQMLLSKDTAELQEEGQYSVQQFTSFIQQWGGEHANKNQATAAVSP